MLYLKALALYLLLALLAAAAPAPPSSVLFPVDGSVYPTGYFYVVFRLGEHQIPYHLDIDTGSQLTWVQCNVPCKQCTPSPHGQYKPKTSDLVTYDDPICVSVQGSEAKDRHAPTGKCDYEVEYADDGWSKGVLARDTFPLKLTNGTVVAPRLVFGCSYDRAVKDPSEKPFTDGVLGLGLGMPSILTQLSSMGLTRNIVGHCLSSNGGGFLFFGSDFLPGSGIVWKPMLRESNHYSLGSADIGFLGEPNSGIKNLEVVFDSGTTYTYFKSEAYHALVALIKRDLAGKQVSFVDDPEEVLKVCWKGAQPFKSIREADAYFKPLVLSFTDGINVQLQMPPESYLIVTEKGNACLGILDSGLAGLGELNVIGDISVHDKLVIFDNEKQRMGWAPADCHRLPKYMDLEGPEVCSAASFGVNKQQCSI